MLTIFRDARRTTKEYITCKVDIHEICCRKIFRKIKKEVFVTILIVHIKRFVITKVFLYFYNKSNIKSIVESSSMFDDTVTNNYIFISIDIFKMHSLMNGSRFNLKSIKITFIITTLHIKLAF